MVLPIYKKSRKTKNWSPGDMKYLVPGWSSDIKAFLIGVLATMVSICNLEVSRALARSVLFINWDFGHDKGGKTPKKRSECMRTFSPILMLITLILSWRTCASAKLGCSVKVI